MLTFPIHNCGLSLHYLDFFKLSQQHFYHFQYTGLGRIILDLSPSI